MRPDGEPLAVESADGTPIACWRTGTGPPLVLVHGAGDDHHRWRVVVSGLADRFTVYAVDRRGRPASGDTEHHSLAAEAADLAAVVDHLGPDVLLLAHSYGALCALEAATRTGSLAGLVCYEPPVPTPGSIDRLPLARRLRALVADGRAGQALAEFRVEAAGLPPARARLLAAVAGSADRTALAGTLAREIEASQGYVLVPSRFAAVTVPVLMLLGGDSPASVRAATMAVADALPRAEIVILDGQSHCAMDVDPAGFLRVVREFLVLRDEQRSPQ